MALLCSFILCCLALVTTPRLTSSSPTDRSISITIPITYFRWTQKPPVSLSTPWKQLHGLAAASLTRARRLKHPNKTAAAAAATTAPLSGHSYGAYTISLSFGTPPQTLPFVMDTGSDLVWFPCTKHYTCKGCSTSSSANPPNIPPFVPKSSSTSKLLGCSNPKCGWIHKSEETRCKDCPTTGTRNCTQICPPYLVLYGSGSTGGLLLSETLTLKHQQVPDFIVGCSLFSAHQPAGIAGFGRGSPSLPSQLGLKKFSFCLLSHRFDDTVETTSLLLEGGSGSGEKTDGASYTPFIRNPGAFAAYYYVGLRKVTVGGQRVKIPYRHLSPGPGGDGGTVVDSGTTFTYMARDPFEAVSAEFARRMSGYARERAIEALTGLRPCFNVSGGGEGRALPEMSFHFKGGAEMRLPAANYFSYVGGGRGEAAMCLTIVTDIAEGGAGGDGGPSIILGNFQMQNYYVEYDLRNERFGFRPRQCN